MSEEIHEYILIPFVEVATKPLYELVQMERDDLPEVRRCFWKYDYMRPDQMGCTVSAFVQALYDSDKIDLVKIRKVDSGPVVWYGHYDLQGGDVLGLHAYKPVDQRLNLWTWHRIGCMALDYAFKIWEARKIITTVPVVSKGDTRMIENLGFVKEGCLREALTFRKIPMDHYVLGILRSEFYTLSTEEAPNDSIKTRNNDSKKCRENKENA